MASSATDFGHQYEVKGAHIDEEKTPNFDGAHPRRSSTVGSVREVNDQTHRKLKSRHIQLIGIGGTIGTALYVQIGRGLMNGGPGSLFIAFTLWYVYNTSVSNRKLNVHRCSVILAVTLSEITPFLKP
jgi:amino acid transporter